MMKKTTLTTLVFLSLSAASTACTTAQFAPARMNDSYAQRTPASQVELFRMQTPPKPYKEIGAVNACCSTDTNGLVNELRQKASENGGDALLGLEPYGRGGLTASVIRYQ